MTVQLTSLDTPTTVSPTGVERLSDVRIGIDLTILGASSHSVVNDGSTATVDHANFPKLASCAHAASEGGIDMILLGSDFRNRTSNRGGELDAARTMAKLSESGATGFSAGTLMSRADEAIDLLSDQRDGWSSIEVPFDCSTDMAELKELTTAAHAAGIHVRAKTAPSDLNDVDFQALTALVDAVRLDTDDPHVARECRFALRSAALSQGRDFDVLIDLGVVISGNMQAARERALLIEGMSGAPLFAGKASVVGTVYDVADAVESWIGLGGADGVIFHPASLPTDLASILRGVLPLLAARSELNAQ